VHDSGPMRGCERIGDLHRDLQRLFERRRAALQPLLERLALEVLHHEEVDIILPSDVVEGADMRMIQSRDAAGFPFEALAQLTRRRHVRGKHLDGHGAIEPRIASAVDLSHAARAEQCDDFIGAESRAGSKRQVGNGADYTRESP
jgi:hypothetical protein